MNCIVLCFNTSVVKLVFHEFIKAAENIKIYAQ